MFLLLSASAFAANPPVTDGPPVTIDPPVTAEPPAQDRSRFVGPLLPSEHPAAAIIASTGNAESAVVKIYATVSYPDPLKPWTKQPPRDIVGSGVVIEGNRILTNAHTVLYASQISIQANKASKIPATVAAIAPGMDLAVLKLNDESFFASHAPLPRASVLPDHKAPFVAYGYHTAATALTPVKGQVLRIDFAPYHYYVSGLRFQTDAVIDPGVSGGAALAGDKMIGLMFSNLADTQSTGYIIPNEEIELFLQDIADGHYDGKPAIFDYLQTLENPTLRSFLKIDASITGVIVHQPLQTSAAYPLKQWDIITRIGDTVIDGQGMVKLGDNRRIGFRYLVQKIAKQGKVPLTIIRAGKPLEVELPVVADRPTLISALKSEYPPYFIYGPLVFSKATLEYLSSVITNASTINTLSYMENPLVTQRGDVPDAEREELVIISSPFFTHWLAQGYSNHANTVVYSVNGTRISSLRHLVTLLRDLKDDFVVIDFDGRGGEALVFPRADLVAATSGILNANGISAQGSPDLLKLWQGGAQK
ncbi:MAG: trypsin-like peptidase domain-containing protein [Pseudomonadota bacterium]